MTDLARTQKLRADLLRATGPGPQPDENFRPTHWNDRIYWLYVGAQLPSPESFTWDSSPNMLVMAIVAKVQRANEWLTALERAVADALHKRGMQ